MLAGLASPWAYPVIGLLAAAESAAMVGLVLPGETAMLLGGFLAYQGHVELGWMLAAAAAGSAAGDQAGYLAGRLLSPRLRAGRLGRRVGPARWARAEAFVRTRGGRAVVAGRFVGVLRALIPALAGMAAMPYRVFVAWELAAALVWAPGLVLAGYAAGSSWQLAAQAAGRAGVLLAASLVVVAVVVVGARRAAHHPEPIVALARRQLARPPLARQAGRYRAQLSFLAARVRPGGALGLSPSVGLLLAGVAGWLFGAVTQDVLDHEESVRLDGPVLWWVAGHREAWLTGVVRVVTELGSGRVLVPLLLVVGVAVALRTRRWTVLGLLGVAELGAAGLYLAVKQLVARPRPPLALALVDTHSQLGFPSGHAAQAAACWGVLAWLVGGLPAWRRAWPMAVGAWTAALLVALAVGGSRVYLGVHWPTDVLGGWALGGLWLAVVLVAWTTLARTRPPASPTTTAVDDVDVQQEGRVHARR